MVRVLPRWRFSPFTSSHMSSVCGSAISSVVTSHGPMGPKVSQPLPLSHGQRLGLDPRQAREVARGEHRVVDLGDDFREVADVAFAIRNPRFLTAGGAVAQ